MYVYTGRKADFILDNRFPIRDTNLLFSYKAYRGIPLQRDHYIQFQDKRLRRKPALSSETIRKWLNHEMEPSTGSIDILSKFCNQDLILPVPVTSDMFLDTFQFDQFLLHLGSTETVSPYSGYAEKYSLLEYYFSKSQAAIEYSAHGGCFDLYRWKSGDPHKEMTRIPLVICPPARVSLRNGDDRLFLPVRMSVPGHQQGLLHYYAGLITHRYNNLTTIYLRQEESATRDVCFIQTSPPDYEVTTKGLRMGHLTTSKVEGGTAFPIPYEVAIIGNKSRRSFDDEREFLRLRPKRGIRHGDDINWALLSRLRGLKE